MEVIVGSYIIMWKASIWRFKGDDFIAHRTQWRLGALYMAGSAAVVVMSGHKTFDNDILRILMNTAIAHWQAIATDLYLVYATAIIVQP